MIAHRFLVVAALTMLVGSAVRAEVKPAPIFADNMMLQADMADPVWGTANVGEEVTVQIDGKSKSTKAGVDGKWMVKIDPIKAGGPLELKINSQTIKNVLVGEVWHASGQSNMRYPLSKAENGKADIAAATDTSIRYYLANFWQPANSRWIICNPTDAPQFSAVAYHFARHLRETLKTPIGIVDTAISGACCEQYMNPDVLAADKELAALVAVRHGDPKPGEYYLGVIKPIIGFGVKGVIWYQGEGNRTYPVTYKKLFPAMIADWRNEWGQGDFPFVYVQLANYGKWSETYKEDKNAALRDAQLSALSVPNTAMVVTIDCAPPGSVEPQDVHYPNKKPVGDRTALAVLALAYGQKIEGSGPIFKAAAFDGGKATVTFTHVGQGLTVHGEKVLGFALAGQDHKWVRAEASIDGDRVVVKSDQVPNPVAVRYAFEGNPQCNLYNKDGLPASPFRSDDFATFATKDGD